MLKVLLVSPRLASNDPLRCGDHTYTDMLLEYPPADVRYIHYEDLIAEGKMRRIRPLQLLGHNLVRVGLLPPDMWAEYLATREQVDLVHIFGFSAVVQFTGSHLHVPIVIGVSTNSYSDLKYYHEWDDWRVKRARVIKRAYLRLINAHDSSLRPERATCVITWSDFARRLHLEEGFVLPRRITAIYPGLPHQPIASKILSDGDCITFLFVGRDFERKNGDMVLEAFRSVHAMHPNTRLLLVGQPHDGRTIVGAGVYHRLFVPRQELIMDIFPKADVLLLPSKAEGFGLAIVEAMSMGIPTIAVDAWAMPEIIRDGENGYLIQPNSAADLSCCMMRIAAQPDLVNHMRENCIEIFQRKFSIQQHNRQMRSIYAQVLDHPEPP